MSERLRQLLHEGVGRTPQPDLAPGALRAATRLGRTRRAAGAGVALAVVAGLTGGFLSWQPGAADPDRTGSDTLDVAADSVPSEWTSIPDTLYFTSGLAGKPGVAGLSADGTVQVATFEFPAAYDGTFSLSPDGQWWSRLDATGLSLGETVRDGKLSGIEPAQITVAEDELCGPHTWSPDGSRIAVGSCVAGDVALLIIDSSTGDIAKTVELPEVEPETMRHFFSAVWNADGSRMVWGDADDGFVIAAADGSDPQAFAIEIPDSRQQDPEPGMPAVLFVGGVTSLSADGRYAGISFGYSEDGELPDVDQEDPNDSYDPQGPGPFSADALGTDDLVDLTTGESVTLPEGIPQIIAMAVSPHGEMLIQHFDPVDGGERIGLYSADWELLDERELPEDLLTNAGGVSLISYL